MGLFDRFQAKKVAPPFQGESKSYGGRRQLTINELRAHLGLRSGENTNIANRLSPAESLGYYHSIPSVYNAVNTIARETANIAPLVFDKEEKREDESEASEALLDVLMFPNTDVSGQEFMEQTVSFFKATGNAFLIAEGKIDFRNYLNSKTRQLFCVSPSKVSINTTLGLSPEEITVALPTKEAWVFQRRVIEGRHRYFYKDSHELYHIRSFNPYKYDNHHLGLSPLEALREDLDLYEASVTHNLSMLQQGTKLSGILESTHKLGDDQQAHLQEQFEKFYEGPENSGHVVQIPPGFKFTPVGMAYEMDYSNFQGGVDIKVYNNYMIPLPTVTTTQATFANMEQSVLSLYNNAIIPAFDRINSEITLFLMPRYHKDWKNFKLDFNPEDIDALQPIRNESLKLMNEIGVNSINELRAAKGDEPAINGDSILQPASNVPVARVPQKEVVEEEEEQEVEEQLLGLSHADGTPLFTKETLKSYLKDE